MNNKKLFLIDGNSLLYRSFYAIRNLSTSKGFPTNAIYGFIQMLRKIKEEQNPSHLGVVFDVKGPTVRHEAYEKYKAQRKPMPEDLVVQLPVLKKILKAMKIPCIEQKQYEADDVLASLARQASERGIATVLVSTDKDLLQLVNASVSVFNPVKNIHLHAAEVEENFGVSPSRVIDVLALQGDASDNIPGVPGIGEKTAKNLIREFGSLDVILNNLEQVKNPRIREAIKSNLDQLKLSRQLVTIEKNLDLPLALKDFALEPPDKQALLDLYQELEFTSLAGEQMKIKKSLARDYKAIWTEEELNNLVSQLKKQKAFALDTETDSPFPTRARLVGISFSFQPHQAFYLPLKHAPLETKKQIPPDRAFQLLSDVLSDPGIKKIGQNIKYDLIVLRREGLEVKGVDLDSMVLSYLLEPNWGKHNLNKLALTYLKSNTLSYHDIVGKGKNEKTMNQVDASRVIPYACQDADFAFQLGTFLWKKVTEEKLASLYRQIEQPLIEILADMECRGVKVDGEALKALSEELQAELIRLQEKIFAHCGVEFNLNSPKQLAQVLYERLGLPPTKKTKVTKGYSTSLPVLQDLSKKFPAAREILEYRQLAKLKSSYADALPVLINPETGRIHTSYNQTVTSTGRLSSSDPNLQNIPARGELGQRFRQAFIPGPGCVFLSADYSQIELRILAHLSQDPALIKTFLKDRDVHQETAAQVFGSLGLSREEQRRRAKIINFSIIYGASAFSLARALGTSTGEAQKFIKTYFDRFPLVKKFQEQCIQEAKTTGFTRTLLGRKRPVPEIKHKNSFSRQAGERIALNTPIQGTAADLIKLAMINIWKEMKSQGLNTGMILQVHDELVFEVPQKEVDKVEQLVQEKMEQVMPLRVPLKVHLGWGINWAEAK